MAKKQKSASDDEAAEGAEAAPAGKFGFLKNKLVLIGVAVVLAAGGGGGWWFMKKGKEKSEQAADNKVAPKKAAFLDMKDMVINISSGAQTDRQSFVKLRVTLELPDAKSVPEVQPLLPRVEDTFQVYMRELRATDLDGSAGMFRLKEELLRRVNLAVYPAKVDAVLFKELLVQ
jgi:flagellar protein FliL